MGRIRAQIRSDVSTWILSAGKCAWMKEMEKAQKLAWKYFYVTILYTVRKQFYFIKNKKKIKMVTQYLITLNLTLWKTTCNLLCCDYDKASHFTTVNPEKYGFMLASSGPSVPEDFFESKHEHHTAKYGEIWVHNVCRTHFKFNVWNRHKWSKLPAKGIKRMLTIIKHSVTIKQHIRLEW